MRETLRIAVVDDDDSVRDSAILVLSGLAHEAEGFASGDHFLEAGANKAWSAVFLDLKMPGRTGLEVLQELQARHKTLPYPVLMISAHGDIQVAVQAIRLGASSFIEKPFTADQLTEAVLDVANLGAVPDSQSQLLDELTPREREVADLLTEGLSNKEVGRALDCSPRTIEIHRARVLKKLGVRNVAGLVRLMVDTSAR
ncbi:MAG: response regulator [Pseudomonadota bacterium]